MEIIREVHCKIMKGLGPDRIEKVVTVYLDDVEEGTSQTIINDMIVADAKDQLLRAGHTRFTVEDIHNT